MNAKKLVRSFVLSGAGILSAAVYMGALDSLHLPQRSKAGKKRVACVGDSITYGCFVAGQPWNSYPKQLERLLGKDYCAGNFGYTNRTANNTADFPYTAEKLYEKSLDFLPDIVLIMLGTNDTKEINWNPGKYMTDLCRLIDSYRDLSTHPKIYLLLPPPVFPVFGRVLWSIRSDVLEYEVLPMCRQAAEEKSVTLINTHDVFCDRRELFVDGVHPNRKGAGLLAETVYDAIMGKAHGDDGQR